MKVIIGKEGLTHTKQGEFPPETECCRCEGIARIGFVATEGVGEKKYVSNLHPNKPPDNFWLHDACAVAVYFCGKCLETTALYNQA